MGSGCGWNRAPQPPTEPVHSGPSNPFAGLPPLHRAPQPEPGFPAGPAAPARVERVLPPLTPPHTTAQPTPGKQVTVTAHPPLAGNPRGAVAFVFDQPMVDARNPPAVGLGQLRVSPTTPGRLQWLGDRTLVFEPFKRLQNATQYSFKLRPPLTSLRGAQLRREVFTGFTTVAPALLESTPAHTAREVDVQPVIRLRFNQPMDPTEVRRHLRLLGPGKPAVEPAPPTQKLGPHVVWLRPTQPLKPSTDYQLVLAVGLRGAEGTIGSLAPVRIRFTTAGPLRLVTARCSQVPCRPGDTLVLETAGSPGPVCGMLRLTPPVEDLSCRVRAGKVVLTGSFRSETRYGLRLIPDGAAEPGPPAPLTVAFGQRQQPLAFFPNRPLLTSWTGTTTLPVSNARRGRLRVAPVEPGMVSTLLTAIADPNALPPFQLTRRPPKPMPVDADSSGFDLGSLKGPALLLAALEETGPKARTRTHRRTHRRTTLPQRTGLSLVARYGWSAGVALLAEVATGQAVARTRLHIRDRAGRTLWQGLTNGQGLAHFPGRRRLRRAGPFTLWAERGKDRTFLVLDGGGEDDIRTPGYLRGQRLPAVERVIGGVFSDRSHYVPGDPVRLFGVLRGQTRLPRGGIGHLSAKHQRVAYRVVSETEEEIATGQVDLGPAGLFRIDFRLPRSVQPGRLTAWLHLPGTRRAYADWVLGSFRVVARRRGLHLTLAAPGNVRMHERPKVTVTLREPSGRPSAGATVRWRLYRQGDAPPPKGHPDFRFGRAPGPAVASTPGGVGGSPAWPDDAVWVAGAVATTNARGNMTLRPHLTAPRTQEGATFELVAEATTLDGRTVRRSATLAARRSRLHLGLRPFRQLVRVEKPFPVWLISVDDQGRPLPAGAFTVTAHRYDGPQTDPRVRGSCRGDLALATGSCRLSLPESGRYLLRVRLTSTAPPDTAPAEMVIYAHGPKPTRGSGSAPAPAPAPAVELIPGRRWYPEGGRARLLLRSPVSPATALLTLERDGIAHARTVRLTGPDTLLAVDLGRGLVPNVWVGVSVLGARQPTALPPTALHERIRLPVRSAADRLHVTLRADQSQALPGTRLPVKLRVTDSAGRPVSAALMLLLQPDTADPPPDLAACLQRDRGPGIALRTSSAHRATRRPRWQPGKGPLPEALSAAGPGPEGPDDAPPAEATAAASTTGLFFRGPVQTNEDGRLALSVPLPRRHGRYRLVALAADRQLLHRLGRDVLPLTVKPALGLTLTHPRILRTGDRVSVVAHIQNHTKRPLRVTVLARADQLPITSRARHVHLAPGARGRAIFSARATRVGLARLQVAALAEGHRAALERRIPVQPSARDHVVQRLGILRSSAALPLRRTTPPSSAPHHQLILSNSPLGVGLSALRWLLMREALTLEAAAARLLALSIAHRHRHTPLQSRLPDTTARRILCRRAIRQISDLELPRGGLRRYDGGPPARAAELAFTLLALSRARTSGCPPPGPLVTALVLRLQTIAADPNAEPAARVTALSALHRHRGVVPARQVTDLLRHWRRLPLVVRSRLLPLIPAASERQRLGAALDRETFTPNPPKPRVELTALRLLAALKRHPTKAVRAGLHQLLALGRSGRWGSARTTTWALLALSGAEPFLTPGRATVEARAWLDGRHWGGRALRPGKLDLIHLSTGRRRVLDPRRLVLHARGGAPLYYLITRVVRRPPRSVTEASASVSVRLTPAGQHKTVTGSKPLPLKVGANAIGRVTLVTTRSIPSTVLRVPIPAGCDVVDPGYPRLARGGNHRFPPPPILDATVRDGVLRLHLADLPPGIHEHRLVIQATTAGRFGCAPATLRRSTDERLLARAARCRPLRVRARIPTR